jgi:hypothetical protein
MPVPAWYGKKNTKNPIPGGAGWQIQKWILDPTLEGTLESSTWVGSRILSLRRKEGRSSWFLKVESANHSFLGFPTIARSLDALKPLVVVATILSGARL